MEHETINWIWAMMILPVLAGLFKSEIGKIFTALGVYLRREYKPRDKVLLLSEGPAPGEKWKSNSIVFIWHPQNAVSM